MGTGHDAGPVQSGFRVRRVSGVSELGPVIPLASDFSERPFLPNDRFTDSEGLTQMAWQWSDESWSGTLLTRGPASVTFQGVAEAPLWTSTFDVRLAEEEEEEEEVEDDDDDDADDEDDDLDDDEEEEEEEEEDEDY